MFPIRRILHPTDFSQHSNDAFQAACALAHDYDARVAVLHVLDLAVVPYVEGVVPEVVEPRREEVMEQLQRIQPPDSSVMVEHVLVEGTAAPEILRVAKEMGADLIVVGCHGRGFLGRMLMGSVVQEVVRKAECPVLTVRTPVTFEVEGSGSAEELVGAH